MGSRIDPYLYCADCGPYAPHPQVVDDVRARAAASGRDAPVPRLSAADLAAQDREEAKRVGGFVSGWGGG